MIVVLDTTETFSDHRLEGPSFSLLETYLRRTSSRLAVPSIVIEETVKHFRERLRQYVRDANWSLKGIQKLLASDNFESAVTIDESDAVNEYRRFLTARIKQLGGSVIDCANVTLPLIIDRSLHRRKPFDGEGQKGFRDAVLWETVLRELIAVENEVTVAFVTKNTKDFGDKEKLSDDLREDCCNIGKSEQCVRLFEGLKSFIEAEVKPHLQKLDDVKKQIEDNVFSGFSLSEFIKGAFDTIQQTVSNHIQMFDIRQAIPYPSGDFHSPYLQELGLSPEDFSLSDVWGVDNGCIAVGIKAVFRGEIACMKTEERLLDAGRQYLIEKHNVPAHISGKIRILLTIILDENCGSVQSHEINEISIDLGSELIWNYS